MFAKRKRSKGQGLVEYALILVLVAVVAIVILATLGQQIQTVFCDLLLALGDSAPDIAACKAPRVTCSGVADGATVSGPIVMEALVTDRDGADTIANVKFYIDGSSTSYRTEYYYRYCLGGGDDPCQNFNTTSLSNGSHTIRAVATDDEDYTGECSITINVAN